MNQPQQLQQFYETPIIEPAAKKADRPASVMIVVPGTFDGVSVEVGIIKYGDKGYHFAVCDRQTEEWVMVQNEQAGIDDETVLTFRVCSITGNWDQYEDVLNKFKGKASNV